MLDATIEAWLATYKEADASRLREVIDSLAGDENPADEDPAGGPGPQPDLTDYVREMLGYEDGPEALARIGFAATGAVQRLGFRALLQHDDYTGALFGLASGDAGHRAALLELAGQFATDEIVIDSFGEILSPPSPELVDLDSDLADEDYRHWGRALRAMVAFKRLEQPVAVQGLAEMLRLYGSQNGTVAVIRHWGDLPLINEPETATRLWTLWQNQGLRDDIVSVLDATSNSLAENSVAILMRRDDAGQLIQQLATWDNKVVNGFFTLTGWSAQNEEPDAREQRWRLRNAEPTLQRLLSCVTSVGTARAAAAVVDRPDYREILIQLAGPPQHEEAVDAEEDDDDRHWVRTRSMLRLLGSSEVTLNPSALTNFWRLWAEDKARADLIDVALAAADRRTPNSPRLCGIPGLLAYADCKDVFAKLAEATKNAALQGELWSTGATVLSSPEFADDPVLRRWACRSLSQNDSLLVKLAPLCSGDPNPLPGLARVLQVRGYRELSAVRRSRDASSPVLESQAERAARVQAAGEADTPIQDWLTLCQAVGSWGTFASVFPRLAAAADQIGLQPGDPQPDPEPATAQYVEPDLILVRDRVLTAFAQLDPRAAGEVITAIESIADSDRQRAVVHAMALAGEARSVADRIPDMHSSASSATPASLRLRTVRALLHDISARGDLLTEALKTSDGMQVPGHARAVLDAAASVAGDGGQMLYASLNEADSGKVSPAGLRVAARQLLLTPDITTPAAAPPTSAPEEVIRRHLRDVSIWRTNTSVALKRRWPDPKA